MCICEFNLVHLACYQISFSAPDLKPEDLSRLQHNVYYDFLAQNKVVATAAMKAVLEVLDWRHCLFLMWIHPLIQ